MSRTKDNTEKQWSYRPPGAFYSFGPVIASSEREARRQMREIYWGDENKPLPRGTEVWAKTC